MIKNVDLLHENGDQMQISENEKIPYVHVLIRLNEFNTSIFNASLIEFTARLLSFDQVLKKAQQYGFKIIRMYMNSKENEG